MQLLLTAITVSLCTGAVYGLRCWECSEALDDANCRRIGKMRECLPNQDACEIEVREHEGWGGHVLLYKHCKQSRACDNNQIQNPRAAFQPSQCNPDDFNSVCRCCCYENECNVAEDACFDRIGCPPLPRNVAHGSVSCTNSFATGSICTVNCNPNTQRTDPASTVCKEDGTWSNELAECLYLQCETRSFLKNGWYVCTNSQFAGSECTAFCRPGYTLVGEEVSTCMSSTMSWDYPAPECEGGKCPDRGTVAGGIVTCSDENNIQSRCRVECLDGRRMDGIADSYCEDAGTWSHELPVCVDIQCPPRGTVTNGRVDCSNSNQVASTCLASCDKGFVLNGFAESECLSTGFWSQPLPSCIKISCPPRGSIIGGVVYCTDGSNIGSKCTAECLSGFQLTGPVNSVCRPDGTWNRPLPVCRGVLCPERSILINGKLSDGCTIRTVGQICRATCDDGMTMEGSQFAICQSSGKWSEPLPSCTKTVCPVLDFSKEPGRMTCTDGFFAGSVCRFRCNAGYRLFGAQTSRCTSSGRWNERMPKCERPSCKDQGGLRFGRISCDDGNKVGSTCSFRCTAEGYEIYPGDRRTNICRQNQRWSSPKPCCARSCPPYAVMDIVLVLDSSSSIGDENWLLLTNFVEGVIRSFIVAPEFANFALFRYNRKVDKKTQVFLNQYPGDVNGVIRALKRIPYKGSGTLTGQGLNHALEESLSIANGNRPDVRDLVIVLTDGKASDDVKTPADALRATGAEILVVGIENKRGDLDMQQLLDIAGRQENLILTEDGFVGLDTAFSTRLGTTICRNRCPRFG